MNPRKSLFLLHCIQRAWSSLGQNKKEENNKDQKGEAQRKEKFVSTLWPRLQGEGEGESIIAAGPLRVAAVIAGIWTQSLRYTASQSGASSMQTVYYHHSFT